MAGRRQGASNELNAGQSSPGRNGVEREQVCDIQRARMLTAMVDEASGRGVGNVTVEHVVTRSGVSRRTFYEIFHDREDCFLAAFDTAIHRIAAVVVPAYGENGSWRSKTRAALIALLECLDYDRATGRLLVVETLGAGPNALKRRQNILVQIITVLEQGRTESKAGTEPPPLTAEAILGGMLSVLHARLLEEHPPRLIELVNPLMSMVVLPYLGPVAARRELERPVPQTQRRSTGSRSNPLKELEIRLTYRTVRVLLAVSASPDASNRAVADRAGIADQGQISKLLSRLEKLGLVSNAGLGPRSGAPNAWALTKRGEEVRNAVAAQT